MKKPMFPGRDAVIFPDGFNALEPERKSRLIGSRDKSAVERLAAMNEGPFEILEVSMEGAQYFVALKGFTVFSSPQRSHSPGSRALYLARSKDPMEGLLLQLLPSHSMTSRHFHEKPVREAYWSLVGRATLETNEGNIAIGPNCHYVVMPFVRHQLRTDGIPALTLLEITGSPRGLDGLTHTYVDAKGT